MRMSRQHFELLARALYKAHTDAVMNSSEEFAIDRLDGVRIAANHIADMCAAQNPRFARDKFMIACGLSAPEIKHPADEPLNARVLSAITKREWERRGSAKP